MKELKCPNCGSMFTVNEADYASIVSQVKNAEFEEELKRRHRAEGAAEQGNKAARFILFVFQKLSHKFIHKRNLLLFLESYFNAPFSNLRAVAEPFIGQRNT